MATILTHPLLPIAAKLGLGGSAVSMRLMVVACFASILPDLDVVGFGLGIAYADPFGHRGFTHSIVFAVAVGLLGLPFERYFDARRLVIFLFLALSTLSHGLIDALTNGGLGVAFFWPLDNTRYFLPWQPIEVSPIGLQNFLSARGAAVILSEVVWIWLPLLVFGLLAWWRRRPVD